MIIQKAEIDRKVAEERAREEFAVSTKFLVHNLREPNFSYLCFALNYSLINWMSLTD